MLGRIIEEIFKNCRIENKKHIKPAQAYSSSPVTRQVVHWALSCPQSSLFLHSYCNWKGCHFRHQYYHHIFFECSVLPRRPINFHIAFLIKNFMHTFYVSMKHVSHCHMLITQTLYRISFTQCHILIPLYYKTHTVEPHPQWWTLMI